MASRVSHVSLHHLCCLTAEASAAPAQVTLQAAAPDTSASTSSQDSAAEPFPAAKPISSAAQQSDSTTSADLGHAQTSKTSSTHVVHSRDAAPFTSSASQHIDHAPPPIPPVSRFIDAPQSNQAVAANPPTNTPVAPSAPQNATPSPSPPVQVNMSVTWLGTSSGAPSLRRNVSCMAVSFGASTYLVDCGEGSSRQLLRANIDPVSIRGIFISHLHGDHCFGLPGMIELISQRHAAAGPSRPPPALQVYGPPGIQQLVKAALSVSLSAGLLALR